MHDPMTVAFDLRIPLPRRTRNEFEVKHYGRWCQRDPFLTIWHVDPEIDGSDDSCGWSRVRCNGADLEWAQKTAAQEWDFWFSNEYGSINLAAADPLEILTAAYLEARRYLGVKFWKPMTARELSWCLLLSANPHDNCRSVALAAQNDKREFERLLLLSLSHIRTNRRWWFQKPRWHVWHWQFQIHALQSFKRWAFSRCAGCGKAFTWGYCPTTTGWHGSGPIWFKSETGVYHSECFPSKEAQ